MDFIEINSGREVVYNFLSRSLIDCPDKQYLQMFEKLYTYLVAIIDDSEDINIIKAKKILLNLINDINASDDKNSIVLKLSKEYTNLFCLGSYSIAPYESVYLSAEKLLKQEPWEEVFSIFNENKFFPKKNANVPEDHIAYELLFMSFLSYRAKESANKSDINELKVIYQKQASFLEKHLLRWINNLCSDISKMANDSNSFYIGIVNFLTGYIDMDYEFLQKVII